LHEIEGPAERGDAAAQLRLAERFRTGSGVSTNAEKALFWYLKAATAGFAEAQYQTALCHLEGRGTKTNVIQAMKWTTLAARQSHREAMKLQDELRTGLTPFQMALARRLVSEVAEAATTNSAGRLQGAEE
jgi:TPR repeat protein